MTEGLISSEFISSAKGKDSLAQLNNKKQADSKFTLSKGIQDSLGFGIAGTGSPVFTGVASFSTFCRPGWLSFPRIYPENSTHD